MVLDTAGVRSVYRIGYFHIFPDYCKEEISDNPLILLVLNCSLELRFAHSFWSWYTSSRPTETNMEEPCITVNDLSTIRYRKFLKILSIFNPRCDHQIVNNIDG